MFRKALLLVIFLLLTIGRIASAQSPANALIIENVGQFADDVRYQVHGGSYALWLTDDSLWYSLGSEHAQLSWGHNATLETASRLDTKVSYYGESIHRAVPIWEVVRYPDLFEGIDLEIGRIDGEMQFRFVGEGDLPPLTITGDAVTVHQDRISLGEAGTLPLPTYSQPYQIINNNITYTITEQADLDEGGCSLPPNILYSTFLGGDLAEEGNSITIDDDGYAYVAGTTFSFTFPGDTRADTGQHGVDVAVSKINQAASSLDYLIWVNPPGENDEDYGYGIDVDNSGNAYVTGTTRSADFCQTLGSIPGYDDSYNGNGDGYAFKVNADGTTFDYCTYLGGSELDIARGIVVESNGTIHVTGGTWSTNYPRTTGPLHAGLRDVFITKLSASGTSLSYSRLFGGTGQEEGLSVALNGTIPHITGWVFSNDLPTTTGAYDMSHNGGADGFVLKLNSTGSSVSYATYLGGDGEDRAYDIKVDSGGKAIVVGRTGSDTFPTTGNAYDDSFNEGGFGFDGFVAQLAVNGSSLDYGTFLGATGEDSVQSVIPLTGGELLLAGYTWASAFPTTNDAYDDTFDGGQDAFLTKLTIGASTLDFSTLWGGDDWDRGFGLQVDAVDNIYLVGDTRSADFCTTANAYDTTHNGDYDMFITKFALPTAPTAIASNSIVIQPTLVSLILGVALLLVGLTGWVSLAKKQ